MISATFTIEYVFEVTDRYFFLVGKLLSGRVKIGMNIDLQTLGIDKRPTIQATEFTTSDNIGLGLKIPDLTDQEKKFLKANSPFNEPISIIE